MYYIGIDWGAKDCGLAWADEETKIATAYKQIDKEELLNEISKVKDEFGISRVIFGVNSEKDKHKRKKILSEIKNLNLKVEFENEAFSTLLAQVNLIESKKKMVSKFDDAEAARIILQSWLDKNLLDKH
ncbi:MAG: RuvX/YqgF family protein [Candidatus Moraniibacteriota bacterium]